MGLSEFDFWEMTLAEVERYLEGAESRARLKAQFDYSLADLIGISVARVMDDKVKFPTVMEAYPWLFEKELKIAEAEAANTTSINNFLSFAMAHNNAMMEKGVEN